MLKYVLFSYVPLPILSNEFVRCCVMHVFQLAYDKSCILQRHWDSPANQMVDGEGLHHIL